MQTSSARNKLIIAILAIAINTFLTLPASNLLRDAFGLNVFAKLYQPYAALPVSYLLFVLGWKVFTNISGFKLYFIPALTLTLLCPLAWLGYVIAELVIR